jgi:hypothetical protein
MLTVRRKGCEKRLGLGRFRSRLEPEIKGLGVGKCLDGLVSGGKPTVSVSSWSTPQGLVCIPAILCCHEEQNLEQAEDDQVDLQEGCEILSCISTAYNELEREYYCE